MGRHPISWEPGLDSAHSKRFLCHHDLAWIHSDRLILQTQIAEISQKEELYRMQLQKRAESTDLIHGLRIQAGLLHHGVHKLLLLLLKTNAQL